MNNMSKVICKGMKKYGITGRRSHIKARVVDYLFKNGPTTSENIANHLKENTRWARSTNSLALLLRRCSLFKVKEKVKIKSTDNGTYLMNVWDINRDKLFEKHGYKES